jgi:hypothetical protein
MLFFPYLSELTPPLPPHSLPRAQLTLSSALTSETRMPSSTHLRPMLPSETQFSLLDASTKYDYLSSTIGDTTLKSHTHSTQYTSTSPKNKSCPMNKWYDEECKALHCQFRHAFTHAHPTPTSTANVDMLTPPRPQSFVSSSLPLQETLFYLSEEI